jgi:hypothetical protein
VPHEGQPPRVSLVPPDTRFNITLCCGCTGALWGTPD